KKQRCFFQILLIIIDHCHSRQGKDRQMKIHQKIIDPDRQVQERHHCKSHGDKGIDQKSSFFSDHSENGKEACKEQCILSHQHHSLAVSPKTADVINKNTGSRRIILKSDQFVLNRWKMVGGQHIFYNHRPVGKVIVMLHFQEK